MISLRLFGGASLERDGAILSGPVAQRHRLALLSLLCLSHPRPLSRDKLLGYLWPERDAGHARNLLKQAVHVLRRTLGEGVILSAGDDLRLGPPAIDCDLLAFQDAIAIGDWERAAGLYSGPLLDGFYLSDAPEFERLLDQERERLRREWRRALGGLAAQKGASGASEVARECWQRLLADDPHDAQATVGLMQALESMGDRAGAIRQARLHEILLEEDFGAGPDAAVRAAADRIRAGSAGAAARSSAANRGAIDDGGGAENTVMADLEAGIPREPARVPARPGHASRRRGALPAVLLMLLVLGVGTVLVRSRARPLPRMDPDLLAVAPFTTLAPSLQPWSEGLVDVLSRSLDGAGALRTVPPTVSLKRWSGRADRASAAALGRRTGAGLVLFGAMARRGPDSLHIRATLLDLTGRQPPSEVEVAGDTLRLDAAVDSLAIAVLRELGRTRPVGAVRRSPVGAKSLPALKAFLRGEQYYRSNLWDSALIQYGRALALDSTFALAYQKLGLVLSWYPQAAQLLKPLDQDALIRRASEFNHGLAPRDSLLVVADSLAAAVVNPLLQASRPPPDYYVLRRRLLDLLSTAERRYPQDPEIWYRIGEFRTHTSNRSVATVAVALSAFDHAIALDSGFAPAYIHTPGLAIAADLGDSWRARRYLASYLRLKPTDERTVPLRLAAALLDPARARLPETGRLIDSADAGVLWALGTEYLSTWPDSAESAVAVRRALVASGGLADFPFPDRLFQYRALAFELTRRGHLEEAYGLYHVFGITPLAQFLNPYDRLALLGAIPTDTVAATFRRALESDPAENATGLVPALAWWYAQRDTASLERLALRVDSVVQRDTINPAVTVLRHYTAAAARAYLVLARGDSAAALQAFTALPDSACGHGLVGCRSQKLTEARLLTATGQDEKAAAVLDRWGELEPLALLERARLAERLGDRETALKCYRYVAAIWLHADPELQRYVEQARAGLQRLSDGQGEGA